MPCGKRLQFIVAVPSLLKLSHNCVVKEWWAKADFLLLSRIWQRNYLAQTGFEGKQTNGRSRLRLV